MLGHGFSAYFVSLQKEFTWNRTKVATAYSLVRMESGLLGPLEGWAIDRWGPRPVVLVGVALFGLGFLLFSQVDSFLTYMGAFSVIALGYSLSGFTPLSAAVVRWFVKKRSRAMGLTFAGQGVGGLLVPLVAWSIVRYDWRPTAIAAGVLIWIVGFPAALLVRHRPEPYGYLPDGAPAASGKDAASAPGERGVARDKVPAESQEFSAAQALRTPAFWLLAIGHAAAMAVVAAVSANQIPHMVQRVHLSLEAAGGVVGLLTVMQVTGQVSGGYLGDRFNKRALFVACMAGHSAGLLVLAYATSMAHLVLFATLHGLAWGVRAPLLQAIRADYFGTSSFATIMGMTNVVIMVAQVSAPLFAAWLADIQDGYQMAFTIIAAIAGAGAIFLFLARRPVHPAARAAATRAGSLAGR